MADKRYLPVAPAATIQVSASVIVTSILTPMLTSWWYARWNKARVKKVTIAL
jgi:2-keto-3-deoxygluconate permease